MNKNRSVIVLAFALGIIGALETGFYYFGKFGCSFGVFWMVMKAVISCFLLSPSLSVADAFKASLNLTSELPFLGNQFYNFFQMLTPWYSLMVLAAPFLTVYMGIWLFFEKILRKVGNLIIRRNWERIYIFGLTDNVKKLVKQEKKECIYTIITSDVVTKDQEVEFNRLNSEIIYLNVLDEDNDLEKFCKKLNKKSSKVLIMESSTVKNFLIYSRLKDYLKEKKVYLDCADRTIEHTVMDYVDSIEGDNLYLFNSYLLKVNKMLEYDFLNIDFDKDYNSVIVGFSRTGQVLLKRLINKVIYSSSNTIQIDIFDKDVSDRKAEFYSNLEKEYCTITKDGFAITSDKADGLLQVNFHEIDINQYYFREELEKLNNINSAFICLKDEETCLNCMLRLKDYMDMKEISFPTVASVEKKSDILVILSKTKGTSAFKIIETGEYFNADLIFRNEYEQAAKSFHEIYNSLNILTIEENKAYLAAEWGNLPYFKKYSNYLILEHVLIFQKWIEKRGYDTEKLKDDLKLFFEKEDGKYICYFKGSNVKFVELINSNSTMKESAMIEHRRWCYERALTGWKYGDSKDDSKRITPCLENWDDLCAKQVTYCKYDLMPIIYLKTLKNNCPSNEIKKEI